MGKKAATELTFNKIIVLILVILVILGVLIFLFKADIMEKIKNLPGYESNPDETISLTEDQIKKLSYVAVGMILAPEKRDYSWFDQWYFEVYKIDNDFKKTGSVRTRLMLDWSSSKSLSNGNIVIARSWDSDIIIGKMEDNRLSITINKESYLYYKSQYNALPDYSDLIKLNNAKYIGGVLFVTKDSLKALPSAEILNTVQSITISDIDKRVYFDSNYYKFNLEPYFTLKQNTLSKSYSGMFFYVKKEKDSIGIYMKTSTYDRDYSDTSLAGRVYPTKEGFGLIYMSQGVGSYWDNSKDTSYDIHNPRIGYSPYLYETNLFVDYNKLSSVIK